ncbi:heme oxygenase-like protein [Bimuria novae-zelandiae CBS 107.79]|uniref:Heme oxygenase-like protein n=1 Tax=Bimuria novae-zelandiae CBS 107.79 TaxID=1447943 RepID=A0A6A5UWH0_9PLEO|nr:heme oxygenase-like protein [Bimuria novae-zelandiae CBS 107.79]
MAKDIVPQASLAGEINTATRYPSGAASTHNDHSRLTKRRSLHAQLNKLITSRIPFALPPLASDPSLYTTGLLHFAHVFLTFESLWNDLPPTHASDGANSPPTSPLLSFLLVNPYAEPELFTSPPSPQTLAFLEGLRPKGIARSSRIKKDLEYLSGLHPTDLDVMLAQYPDKKVAAFCAYIRKSVGHKPHVLVAYAWCFYMAVFSGGRWIRGQLLRAPPEFWRSEARAKGKEEEVPLAEKGLLLWSFDGKDDGDSIKKAFNERLLDAESLFTPDERVDIIEESKAIFKFCAELVHELDDKLGTDVEQLKRLKAAQRLGHQASPRSDDLKTHLVMPPVSHTSTWLQRPEVTGAALALGCLACAVILRFSL